MRSIADSGVGKPVKLLGATEIIGPILGPPSPSRARDADFAPIGDVTAIIKPEVKGLRARNGDDSAVVKIPGKNLVDDINKSIGTQLNARQVQDLALLIVVDIVSMLGPEESGNSGPAAGVPSKPDLSPTEIMANARKALSAAESAYMKYPNEITRDAYNKAIETVQALTKSGN